jgi:transposase
LFYKTENCAETGDRFMSPNRPSELNGANPFDYLTELQRHAEELAENPAACMPCNYGETLQQPGTNQDPA